MKNKLKIIPLLLASIFLMGATDAYYTVNVDSTTSFPAPDVTSSRASPTLVSATPAITLDSDANFQKQYIVGNGGPVTVTANPALPTCTVDGQELLLTGRSDTNTVTYTNGNGIVLNGNIVLGADDQIRFSCDLTNWVEISRNN